MKLCRCGRLVKDRCEHCQAVPQHRKTTAERGYGHDWRQLSERKRAADPLCERCLERGISTPATEVHHIQPIATHPELRLVISNLMSVCHTCHEAIEAAPPAQATTRGSTTRGG